MRTAIKATLLVSTAILCSCGGSADSQADGDMRTAASAGDVNLSGQFELMSEAPLNFAVQDIELTCQPATPGSPFRAMWHDPDTGTDVTVTGWPDENGGRETRVDLFQVLQQTPDGNQTIGRLTSATLAIEKLSSSGAVSTYAVEASGVFEQGGTFTASGNCLA
jgi:hypothetical protein